VPQRALGQAQLNWRCRAAGTQRRGWAAAFAGCRGDAALRLLRCGQGASLQRGEQGLQGPALTRPAEESRHSLGLGRAFERS